jgi:hypothetical protein
MPPNPITGANQRAAINNSADKATNTNEIVDHLFITGTKLAQHHGPMLLQEKTKLLKELLLNLSWLQFSSVTFFGGAISG